MASYVNYAWISVIIILIRKAIRAKVSLDDYKAVSAGVDYSAVYISCFFMTIESISGVLKIYMKFADEAWLAGTR